LNGRDTEKLLRTKKEFLANGYEVGCVTADIRHPDRCNYLINEAVKIYSQLDILVNKAAMSSRGFFEHMADKNFTILSETNYTGQPI